MHPTIKQLYKDLEEIRRNEALAKLEEAIQEGIKDFENSPDYKHFGMEEVHFFGKRLF